MAAELATGYVSLTVKYGDAMSKINQDIMGISKTAKKAGTDAGQSLTSSFVKSAKIDGSASKKMLSGATTAAKSTGGNAAQEFIAGFKDGARQGMGRGGGGNLFGDLKGKAASGGKDAASNFVEGMGGPLAAIGTKTGPIGLALTAAVGLGLAAGGILGKQIMAGVEQETRNRNFAASVGISPQEGAKAAVVAGKAYANNYGASVKDNLDVAKLLIQTGTTKGADDPALQKTIEQIQTVATVTGETADEVVRGTSQMVKTGMAGNVAEAMDLITVASQKGLNINGDLIDTMNEYGTQFRKIGITGPQAIGAINQLVKGGARDSDVAADALKEFSIRAIDGSKSTGEAYTALGLDVNATSQAIAAGGPAAATMSQTVISRLKAIQDPVQRNTVGVALFGTQFEDLGGAINNLDLSTAAGELGQVGGAVQRASDTMSGTGNSIESAKRNIEVAVSSMQAGLAQAFGPALQEVATWVSAHQADITGFFITLADVILAIGQDALTSFGQTTQALGQFLNAVGDIIGGVIKGLATVQDVMGHHDTANEMKQTAEGFFNLGTSVYDTGTSMVNAAGQVGKMREELAGFGQDTKNAAANAELLKTGIETLPDGHTIVLKDTSAENIQHVKDLGYEVTHLPDGKVAITVKWTDTNGQEIPPDQLRPQFTASNPQTMPGERIRPGQHATGGSIRGSGGPTSDSIPFMGSTGEHVFTARDVVAMGGQRAVYAFRNWLHRKVGGFLPLRDPRGVDPHGGSDGGPGLGPFAPWWNQDWMPPEHPEKVGPSLPGVQGKWWGQGPTRVVGGIGSGVGKWFPPIGPNRKPLPGERWPEEWARGPRTIGFKRGGALGAASGFGEGNLQHYSVLVGRSVKKLFPEIQTIGGYREHDEYPWHPSGRAVDIMIPGGDTQGGANPEGKALGDEIYAYLSANKDALGIENLLWQTMTGGNHFNHIHVQTKDSGGTAKPGETYELVGSRGGKKSSGRKTVDLSELTNESAPGDVADAIISEGKRRGYSEDEIRAILSTAIGESGLKPGINDGVTGTHHGIFQQDSSYPGRGTASGQISGFFDRLDNTTGSIYDRISRTPAEGGVQGGGYGQSWIDQYKDQASGFISDYASAAGDTADDANAAATDAVDNAVADDNPYRALMDIDKEQKDLDTRRGEAIKKILPDFGQLADIGVGGIKESLLPTGFEDPTQWPMVKSAAALLHSIGILSGNPQVAAGLDIGAGALSGSGSQMVSGIEGLIPKPFGTLATPQVEGAPVPEQFPATEHQGTGAPPGPGPVPVPGSPGPGGVNAPINIENLNDNSGRSVDKVVQQQGTAVNTHLGPRRII